MRNLVIAEIRKILGDTADFYRAVPLEQLSNRELLMILVEICSF